MKGKVKWYDINKGYGFIQGYDGSFIFAHRSDLSYFEVYLKKGDLAEYNVIKTKSGVKAIDIIAKNRLNNGEINNLLI